MRRTYFRRKIGQLDRLLSEKTTGGMREGGFATQAIGQARTKCKLMRCRSKWEKSFTWRERESRNRRGKGRGAIEAARGRLYTSGEE